MHHHVLCRDFLWNIKSPRWLSPSTAQIWWPMTFAFFQNWNHLWKGRDFRLSKWFRKIQRGRWWWLGDLCEVPRRLLWRGLRRHSPMYTISCIFFNKCLYFSYDMAGYLLDRPRCIYMNKSSAAECLLTLEKEEGRGREQERERETSMWETSIGCLLYMPWPDFIPATQVCALTGDRTQNLLVYETMFQTTEPPG